MDVKKILISELLLNDRKNLLSKESLVLINDWSHVNYVLGIKTKLNEYVDQSTRKRIIEEQIILENFIDSVKTYLKDKYNDTVAVVKTIPDIIILLKEMTKSENTIKLANNLMHKSLTKGFENFKNIIEKIINKIKGVASKVGDKLKGTLERVTNIVSKLDTYEGWKGFLFKAGLLLIINYIIQKLVSPIQNSIELLATSQFTGSLVSSLDMFKGLHEILPSLASITPLIGWFTAIGLSISMISDVFTPVSDILARNNYKHSIDLEKK
jgi:type I site-specific restriction endonuclease